MASEIEYAECNGLRLKQVIIVESKNLRKGLPGRLHRADFLALLNLGAPTLNAMETVGIAPNCILSLT
jgi:hypothetical protein